MPDYTNIFHTFRERVFRLSCRWGDGQGHHGTCFPLGVYPNNREMIVATARHLLEGLPDDMPVVWTVQGFGADDEIARTVEFTTDKRSSTRPPFGHHIKLDFGYLILPRTATDGSDFMRVGELGLPVPPSDRIVVDGTRVCWAGYSAEVEETLGRPYRCYYEGVVSAVANRDDLHLYIIDGHLTSGVSGAPVWCWSDEGNRPEVCGIMTTYGGFQKDKPLPGYCIAEPVNELLAYIQSWDRLKKSFVNSG